MAIFKTSKIGHYGANTRAFQKRLSFERMAYTSRVFNIYKYLGDKNQVTPSISDIQDLTLLESRDRAYEQTPVAINGWHESMVEDKLDLSRFGLINPLGEEIPFMFHIMSFEADGLGRYLIPGDVIEVPFLELDGSKSLWEVSDVDRKRENETFMVNVKATPLRDKTETSDLSDLIDGPSAFDAIMDDVEDDREQMTNTNIDTTDYEVSNPQSDEPYNAADDPIADFLDNPNARIF